MSIQKLQKKIVRELKASPQKAAMLALLAIVAAWFWAPLVFKSRGGSAVAPAPVAATPAPAVAAVAVQPTAAATQPNKQGSWKDIAACIDHDPLMSPAPLTGLAEKRNPFVSPVDLAANDRTSAKKPGVEKEGDDPDPDKPPPDPDELGLKLSTTLVGRSKRAALISGRTYELGSKIRVEGEAFRLVEVQPNQIVLERDGQQYTLSIKRRKSDRIDVRRATP